MLSCVFMLLFWGLRFQVFSGTTISRTWGSTIRTSYRSSADSSTADPQRRGDGASTAPLLIHRHCLYRTSCRNRRGRVSVTAQNQSDSSKLADGWWQTLISWSPIKMDNVKQNVRTAPWHQTKTSDFFSKITIIYYFKLILSCWCLLAC